MLISKLMGERKKEYPAEAVIKSHVLLTRAGYIRQVGSGLFSLTYGAQKIASKIEKIIREEMDAIDGQEVKLPVCLPAELWIESGRYATVGEELVRFKDRNAHDMVLGMTHEEAAVSLAKANITSYNQLPFMIYQIQTKFRDEARSRAGLIRVREFTMKDGYSFHNTYEDLNEYYDKVLKAYERIFARMGLKKVVAVLSDTGMMGGSVAHEFMLLTEAGEDCIVLCDNCGYKANQEIAKSIKIYEQGAQKEKKEVFTGQNKEIADVCKCLGVQPQDTVKAVCFAVKGSQEIVCVFLRGDLEVNEAKLKRVTQKKIAPLEGSKAQDGISYGNIGPIDFGGKDICVVFDSSLEGANNLVCGANKPEYHITGLSVPRDLPHAVFEDVAKVKENQLCPHCNSALVLSNGIEVGNIFQLGTKYTESMNFSVIDENGKQNPVIMGCYGIGVGRALASIAEELSDEKGLVFPMAVAPWQVYLCGLRLDDPKVADACHSLYQSLKQHKIEVLFDDRTSVTAGTKFHDFELMGVPIRLVVSPKTLDRGAIEVVTRYGDIKRDISLQDAVQQIQQIIEELA